MSELKEPDKTQINTAYRLSYEYIVRHLYASTDDDFKTAVSDKERIMAKHPDNRLLKRLILQAYFHIVERHIERTDNG